jgi:thiol-disulfide isomerase/thioredoxin
MRRSAVFCALILVAACAANPPSPPARDLHPRDPKEQKPSAAKLGESPPAFSVASLTTDSKVTVAAGQVTLVFFWATWNEPCKKSFPKLQELYAKYHARGVEIAALSVDDESEGCAETNGWGDTCVRRGNIVADAAKSWGAKFPVGWDGGHAIASQWAPSSMPSLYLLDRHGIVRHIHRGWHDGEEADVDAEILALL